MNAIILSIADLGRSVIVEARCSTHARVEVSSPTDHQGPHARPTKSGPRSRWAFFICASRSTATTSDCDGKQGEPAGVMPVAVADLSARDRETQIGNGTGPLGMNRSVKRMLTAGFKVAGKVQGLSDEALAPSGRHSEQ